MATCGGHLGTNTISPSLPCQSILLTLVSKHNLRHVPSIVFFFFFFIPLSLFIKYFFPCPFSPQKSRDLGDLKIWGLQKKFNSLNFFLDCKLGLGSDQIFVSRFLYLRSFPMLGSGQRLSGNPGMCDWLNSQNEVFGNIFLKLLVYIQASSLGWRASAWPVSALSRVCQVI